MLVPVRHALGKKNGDGLGGVNLKSAFEVHTLLCVKRQCWEECLIFSNMQCISYRSELRGEVLYLGRCGYSFH